MTAVRVRGIYATALTRRLLEDDHEVVDPSDAIDDRFDDSPDSSSDAAFGAGPADVSIATTRDRQGIEVGGDPEGVADLREELGSVALDALSWPDPAPVGAVCNAVVDATRGGGAVVDLPGGASGYLPFDAVDGYVDVGDRLRVQVVDPRPPWDDRDPRVDPGVRVERPLVVLERGRSGVRADATDADATALARTTGLLDAEAPEGWGIRWRRGAVGVDHAVLDEALARAASTAVGIDDALEDAPAPGDDAPRAIATPSATGWVWFGRESRFALDADRRAVTTTIPGHHRIKAAAEAASAGVDLAEALIGDVLDGGDGHRAGGDVAGEPDFPFDAVARRFGPAEGDRVAIHHGKPGGDLYALGRGEVTEYDPEGRVTVRREIRSEGEYDGLGTPREPGDVATTKLREGRWWYPTAYAGPDGERKGTYVNVCTPVELFPDAARYVDLHVDVVAPPDGEVRVVDEEELAAAVEAGHVSEALAERAREVAATVERALSE